MNVLVYRFQGSPCTAWSLCILLNWIGNRPSGRVCVPYARITNTWYHADGDDKIHSLWILRFFETWYTGVQGCSSRVSHATEWPQVPAFGWRSCSYITNPILKNAKAGLPRHNDFMYQRAVLTCIIFTTTLLLDCTPSPFKWVNKDADSSQCAAHNWHIFVMKNPVCATCHNLQFAYWCTWGRGQRSLISRKPTIGRHFNFKSHRSVQKSIFLVYLKHKRGWHHTSYSLFRNTPWEIHFVPLRCLWVTLNRAICWNITYLV